MRRWILLCMLILGITSWAQAATYHIRPAGTAASCVTAQGGTGNSDSFNLIQEGVNCATAAGDIVNVHAGTYVENVQSWPASGIAGNPIIVQNAPGDVPVLRSAFTGINDQVGVLRILDRSFIRIQGLTFDGTTERVTIRVLNSDHNRTAGSHIEGIEILNNIFTNNGNQASETTGDSSTIYLHSLGRDNAYSGATLNTIRGNTFGNASGGGNYGHDILLLGSSNTLVEQNTSQGIKGSCNCGWNFWEHIFIKITASEQTSWRNVVQDNEISNISSSPWDNIPADSIEMTAVRLDVDCDLNVIQRNRMHDIGVDAAWSTARRSYGIYIENGSDSNIIRENIIYNIGETSIRLGSSNTIIDGTQILNNVLYNNGEIGILLHHARNTVVRNNIVMNWTKAAIYVTACSVNSSVGSCTPGTVMTQTYSDNLYFESGNTQIGRWNESDATFPFAAANLTLAQWNSATGETSSQSVDPLFVSAPTNMHLQSTSPGCGAGFGGVDIGAYPDEDCGGAPTTPQAPTNLRVVGP